MFLEDGRFELGVAMDAGPDIFRTNGDRTTIMNQLRGILESVVPPGQRLRIYVESRRGSSEEISLYRQNKTQGRAIFRMLAEERARAQENLAQQGERLSWRIYFLLTGGASRSKSLLNRLPWLRAGLYTPFSPGELQKVMEEAQVLREGLLGYLERAGFTAWAMNDQEIFQLCYRFLNDHEALNPYLPDSNYASERTLRQDKQRDPQTLKRQLARTEIYNLAHDYLHLGKDYVRIYNMYGPPNATEYGFLNQVLLLERAYFVLEIIHPPQGPILQALENRKRQAWQLNSDTSSAPESSVANAVSDLLDALQRQERTGEHFLKWGAALLIRGESVEHLDQVNDVLVPRLGSTLGARWRRIQEYLAHTFSLLLPFSGRYLDEHFTGLSNNLAHAMVFYMPWIRSQMKRATCLSSNRYAGFTNIDLFDSKATSWNTVVIGASGSGKTFTVQMLLSDAMAEGNLDLIIIDKKGDYTPLVTLAGGATIPIAPGAGVRLNMFDLPPDSLEPSEEKLTFLQRVFHIMKGEHEDPDLFLKEQLWMEAVRTAYQAALERSGQEGKAHLRPVYLSDVLNTLPNLGRLAGRPIGAEEKMLARRLAVEMGIWTQGAMGRFLDGPTNVVLGENPVVYFDIAGFDAFDDPRVTALGISLISQLIYDKLNRAPRDRRKIIIFDEAHAVFKLEASAALVTDLYRRARSYGAGVWTITQSITDYQGPYVKGVLDSTSIFMILRVPEQEKLVVQTLGLPETVADYLATLERRNGVWSELLYVLRGEDSRLRGDILRIAPTPLDYWCFTSSAQDVARRQRIEKDHGLLKALQMLSGIDLQAYQQWFVLEKEEVCSVA